MILFFLINEFVIKFEFEVECDFFVISFDEFEMLLFIFVVFCIVDFKWEVEVIKDKCKMICFGFFGLGVLVGFGVLLSVVVFMLFDYGENVNLVEFLRDSSLMVVGSLESCVRFWSLKGDKLKKKKVDIEGNLVEDEGLLMRKFVGYFGLVYFFFFDFLYGFVGLFFMFLFFL